MQTAKPSTHGPAVAARGKKRSDGRDQQRMTKFAGVRPTRAVPPGSHWPWHRIHRMGVEPGRKPTWNSPETLGANYSEHQTQECPRVCQALCGANSPTQTFSLESALHPEVIFGLLTRVLCSWCGMQRHACAQAFSCREQIPPVMVQSRSGRTPHHVH